MSCPLSGLVIRRTPVLGTDNDNDVRDLRDHGRSPDVVPNYYGLH